jgi:hypothetical protein
MYSDKRPQLAQLLGQLGVFLNFSARVTVRATPLRHRVPPRKSDELPDRHVHPRRVAHRPAAVDLGLGRIVASKK